MTKRIHMIQLDDETYKFVAACVGMGIAGVNNHDEIAATYLTWLEGEWSKRTEEERLALVQKLTSQITPERLG